MTGPAGKQLDRSIAGDTLFEVLVAMTIMAITAVAIMAAFASALGATAEQTHLAQLNTILKSYAEVATSDIQDNSAALYESCGTASYYTSKLTSLPTVPSGYSVSITSVTYWSGTAFTSSCTSGSTATQLITATVTGPSSSAGSLSFAVSDFSYVAPTKTAPGFSPSTYTYTVGVGSSWSYTVTTSAGSPAPALTTSTLPSGVTFVDNGNGTGTLTGASTLSAGSYTITITANNSVGSAATLTFDLVVASAPVFTSASSVSFAAGTHVSFTVSATDVDSQSPALALDTPLSGALKNLTFTDNGNGTGTLTGTLVSGTTGSYSLTFEADNSQQVATTQTVTVTIPTTPVFTSASSVTWSAGSTVSFTVSAVDTDVSEPSLALTSTLSGAVANLTFVNNGNGTGTFSGTLVSGQSGSNAITFQATNSAGQTTTQSFTAKVVAAPVFTGSYAVTEVSGATGVSISITATDTTDSTYPTISWTAPSSGALENLTLNATGSGTTGTATLTGDLVAGNGVYTATLKATNSFGVVTTQTLTVYTPTVPVFTSGTSITITGNSGSAVNQTIATATDSDDPNSHPSFPSTKFPSLSSDPSIMNLTFTDNGNGSLKISGTLSGSTGPYTVTIVAQNAAGQQTSQVVTIQVT